MWPRTSPRIRRGSAAGTMNVLDAAVAGGVRKVIAASFRFGVRTGRAVPTKKITIVTGNATLYGGAQDLHEGACAVIPPCFGPRLCSRMRYFTVYGPRNGHLRPSTREVLVRWRETALPQEKVGNFGDGTESRLWTSLQRRPLASQPARSPERRDRTRVFNVASGQEDHASDDGARRNRGVMGSDAERNTRLSGTWRSRLGARIDRRGA